MKIIADYREKPSGIIKMLRKESCRLIVQEISCGDYIINNHITVERKTALDFLVSIIDGRLFRQVANLRKNCQRPIMVIEGNPYQERLNVDNRAIKGALINVQTIWYMPVLYSRSIDDTIEIFKSIGNQCEKSCDVVNLRGGYRSKRLISKKLYLLQGLPQVGSVRAKRLLNHFQSVSRIMNATVAELKAVDGIGSVAAEKIREILDVKSVIE